MSTKEAREKEAKKLKYRKMGFSKMIDSGEIDFGDGKKSSKKSFEHPMAEERFQQTAKARLKKSGLEDSEIGDPRTDIKDYATSERGERKGYATGEKRFRILRPKSKDGYKHGSYVYAEPNPNVDILKYKTKDGKDDGKRYRVEDSEMKVSKKKPMGRPSLPMPAKKNKPGGLGGLGRGMGLQDEKLNPGKIYKAKRGSGLDLPVINSVKPTVNKTKRAQNLSRMKIQFTKQKNRAGANPNSPFDKKNANVVKHTRVGGPSEFVKRRMKLTGPFSSMDEMRQAKGFKPGESNTAFLKRRMDLRAATKAVSATKIGKIALGVGAAGVAASQYLKSKMNEKNNKTLRDAREQKKPGIPSETTQKINKALSNIETVYLKKDKKMGGGMMKKYSIGGVSSKEVYTNAKANVDAKGKKHMTMNDLKEARRETYATKKMGGGMMQGKIYKASEGIMLSAYKRPTMSIQEGAAKARERNKKQDERKKEIDKAAKKYRVGGGGANKYGPHKVDVNRQATEALLGRGPIQEKIIKFADKFNKRLKPKRVVGRNMGGMMQRPMGYRSGTMVQARGCKLGRTRPTKIT
jgi:hypothetical protein